MVMWLLTVVLTIILWLIIDNILIAAILAIFAVYSYTLVRALYLVKKENKLVEAVNPMIKKEEVNTEEVDTSYVDFMEENYKK